MGPLGWQETLFIFVFALLIFGPKKLPELGKNIGKWMGEFRRATNELKGTWDREMANMERESGIKEATQQIDRELAAASLDETYHGTSSSYDSGYEHGSGHDPDAPATFAEAINPSQSEPTSSDTNSPDGATATEGAVTSVAEAESPASPDPASAHYVPDTVPRDKNGSETNGTA